MSASAKSVSANMASVSMVMPWDVWDPGGFFDRYGFDVDSGAAKKVYYG